MSDELAGRLYSSLFTRYSALGSWYFRGRYLLLSRILGLQPEGGAHSPKGTLFVEIDGLGYGHLRQAIEGGYLPFTSRLLASGQFKVYRWRCGLAADTPPVQSGLFYGTSEGVVGFYWWDRRAQKRIAGANPYDMRRVQAELAARAGHEGLLAGGSSYSNIMSGGARYSVLTIAGANPHWFRPGEGLLRALAMLCLNPGKAARFCFDAFWELLQEMEDRAFVTAMDRPRVLEGAFPIVRVLLNVLAREIVTTGTRVDMLRGVPVIYACYIGYDVVAHHSGPLSRNSLRVLRGIDGAIRKLYETRDWAGRKYDLVLLSDHGMTASQAVADAFDSDFHDWVEQWWRHGAQASPRYRAESRRYRRRLHRRAAHELARRRGSRWLSRIAGSVARRSSGWLRTWGRIGAWTLELGSAGAIKLGERFLEQEEDPGTPRVAVISCGPLSQIWVREVERRLTLDEVEILCPGFLAALVEHPAVAVVAGRAGDEVVVIGRGGRAYLRPPTAGDGQRTDVPRGDAERGRRGDAEKPLLPLGEGWGEGRLPVSPRPTAPTRVSASDAEAGTEEPVVLRVEGTNPLAVYEEPDVVARQVAAFAGMEACGDVICFAALFQPTTLHDATPGAVGAPHIYSFEHQLGTHASVGGDQSYPFIILPAHLPFDPAPIVTASDLYRFLRHIVPARAPALFHRQSAPEKIGKMGFPGGTAQEPC